MKSQVAVLFQRGTLSLLCATLLMFATVKGFGQEPPPYEPPPQDQGPPPQMLPPEQLDDLVAPVALYPDSLLSQVLVASTYPLEIVEAAQWAQQNRGLTGQALIDAAKNQNWDASIQALVPFPDVLGRLSQDVRWTTALGNAFLAQQNDVMAAVQRMRARAESAGKLRSNQYETVDTVQQNGQQAIEIQPADPQVVYVPAYNPEYVWGPPVYGYPPLYYPALDIGFGWGPGIYVDSFFGGCCGWGGWGWGPNWFGGGIYVNNYFFHRYGFHEWHDHDFVGRSAWEHDPGHRWGVPYPDRQLNARYRGGDQFVHNGGNQFRGGTEFRGGGQFNSGRAPEVNRGNEFRGGQQNFQGGRPQENFRSAPAQRFGTPQFEQRPPQNHSVFGGVQDGGRARIESDHGYSSFGGGRGGGGSSPAPRNSAPAGRGGGRR